MTKLNALKFLLLSVLVILLSVVAIAIGCVGSKAETTIPDPTLTEPSDVYWMVSNGTLILSSEQGNTGLSKWSKTDIAKVKNASDVPWNSSRSSITKLLFYSEIAPSSIAFWFAETNLTSLSAVGDGKLFLNLNYVTNADSAFRACEALTTLDLSATEAPLVTNIESIFDGCVNLASLDLSFLRGAPIGNMINAFYNCKKLTSLDLSVLDTSAVTDLTAVLYGCAALKTLDLTSLDLSSVTTLEKSFSGCTALTSITLPDSLDSAPLENLAGAFLDCSSLKALSLDGIDTSRLTTLAETFSGCTALSELDLGDSFRIPLVNDIGRIFRGCAALTEIDTSTWQASSVKNAKSAFAGCSSLVSIDLSGLHAAPLTEISSMFSGCSALLSIDLSPLDTSRITDLSNLFYNCSSLVSVDLSVLDTSRVTDLSELFHNCFSLVSADLSVLDTSAVQKMEMLFSNCSSLKSFTFLGIETSSLTSLYSMFSGATALETVSFKGIDTSLVTNISGMFNGCTALHTLDMTDFDATSSISSESWFVARAPRLREIKTPTSIAAGVSISLDSTFYNGTAEIDSITSADAGKSIRRRFDINYRWNSPDGLKAYSFEPSYFYYGTDPIAITAEIDSDGFVFEGWTLKGSAEPVTSVTSENLTSITLYAKMTPIAPIKPTVTVTDDITAVYGDILSLGISFDREELHTYDIRWYRSTKSSLSDKASIGFVNETSISISKVYYSQYGITVETDHYLFAEITVKRTDNGESVKVTTPPIKVRVNRFPVEITTHPQAIDGLIYNGKKQFVTTTGETNHFDAKIFFSTDPESGFTQLGNMILEAGTRTLYYTVLSNNYLIGTDVYSLTVTINPAEPTLSFENTEATVSYTGSAPLITPPTVTLLGSESFSGEISYSYVGSSSGTGLPTAVGTYVITASIDAFGNYSAATSSNQLTLRIDPIPSALEDPPTPKSDLVYNGKEQPLLLGGTAIGGTLSYSLDGEVWSGEIPTAKNAGSYTVYYKVVGDANHTDTEPSSLTVTIAKAEITLTPDSLTVCIGESYTLTYKTEGLADSDSLQSEPILSTDADLNTVGEYTISATGADAGDNYTLVYSTGKLTVRDHEWNSGEVSVPPTCTENGERKYTCIHNASHTYTDLITSEGHKESTVPGKPESCDEDGYTESTACSVCGEVITPPTKLTATGHSYDSACDTTCSVCGDKREAAPHKDEDLDDLCDECGESLPTEESGGNSTEGSGGNSPEGSGGNSTEGSGGNSTEGSGGNSTEGSGGNSTEGSGGNSTEGSGGNSTEGSGGISTGATVAIAVGSAGVLGIGGFGLFWFVIKKKSLAELLAIFKK